MSRRSSSVISESRKLSKQHNIDRESRSSKKKWTSAFRVVQSLNRFRNITKEVGFDFQNYF